MIGLMYVNGVINNRILSHSYQLEIYKAKLCISILDNLYRLRLTGKIQMWLLD